MSPSHLLEIDHYIFGGRRDWSRPFRALIPAGAGATRLAAQLAERGCPGELVTDGAAAVGRFDYIECRGVPADLAGLLAPDGGMGVALPGRIGQTGADDLRALLALLALLAPDGSPRQAQRIRRELPPTNWLRRNAYLTDADLPESGGHAFSVPDLREAATAAGLKLQGFLEPARYDPMTFLRDPQVKKRVAALDDWGRAAFAEALFCGLPRHVCYLVGRDSQVRPAVWSDPGARPLLRDGTAEALAQRLGTQGQFVQQDPGGALLAKIPLQSAAFARRIDGQRTVEAIRADLAGLGGRPLSDADCDQLFGVLVGFNLVLLRVG